MKKVIVTGAAGFIGKHVVKELLNNGIQVIALVREQWDSDFAGLPVRTVSCSMDAYSSLPSLISDRDIDTIYHFAWQGVSNADSRNEHIQLANIASTLALVDAAKTMGVHTFIGAGSLHEAEAMQEMESPGVISNLGYMYKAAKISAHFMAKAKAGAAGIRFFWPVITNTYGEGEHSGRLINTIIRKIYAGETPSLSVGKQLYDFVHISDVAKAFRLIDEKGRDGENYIIGSGNAKPLKIFLQEVGEIANKINGGTHIPLGFGDIQSNVVFLPKNAFSIDTLHRDTSFLPAISFTEGIVRTAKWMKINSMSDGAC